LVSNKDFHSQSRLKEEEIERMKIGEEIIEKRRNDLSSIISNLDMAFI
jgi:hypothetical protein